MGKTVILVTTRVAKAVLASWLIPFDLFSLLRSYEIIWLFKENIFLLRKASLSLCFFVFSVCLCVYVCIGGGCACPCVRVCMSLCMSVSAPPLLPPSNEIFSWVQGSGLRSSGLPSQLCPQARKSILD